MTTDRGFINGSEQTMPYGMPHRLIWPPSPLWGLLCIAAVIAAAVYKLS